MSFRINKIEFKSSYKNINGNTVFDFSNRQDKYIALVGKNGSGKSRILDAIYSYYRGETEAETVLVGSASRPQLELVVEDSNTQPSMNIICDKVCYKEAITIAFLSQYKEANDFEFFKIWGQDILTEECLFNWLNEEFRSDLQNYNLNIQLDKSDFLKSSFSFLCRKKDSINSFLEYVSKIIKDNYSGSEHHKPANYKFCFDMIDDMQKKFRSVGQQQLFVLDLIFNHFADENSLIILDEPDASIDYSTKYKLLDMVKSCPGQVIITTHDPILVSNMNPNNVFMLEDGHISDNQNFARALAQSGEGFNMLDALDMDSKTPIIFCEGEEKVNDCITDKELYQLLYPNCKIVTVRTCVNVKEFTEKVNNFFIGEGSKRKFAGITDLDDKIGNDELINNLKSKKIYTLKVSEKECLFLTPKFFVDFRNWLKDKYSIAFSESTDEVFVKLKDCFISQISQNQGFNSTTSYNIKQYITDIIKNTFSKIEEIPFNEMSVQSIDCSSFELDEQTTNAFNSLIKNIVVQELGDCSDRLKYLIKKVNEIQKDYNASKANNDIAKNNECFEQALKYIGGNKKVKSFYNVDEIITNETLKLDQDLEEIKKLLEIESDREKKKELGKRIELLNKKKKKRKEEIKNFFYADLCEFLREKAEARKELRKYIGLDEDLNEI